MADRFNECRTYLGDGVYAELDPARGMVLYTSDGYDRKNVVFLEGEVVDNLILFVRFHRVTGEL